MRLLSQYREGHPWPNGGFPFKDPRTGLKFDGMSADLKLQAQNVIKHRRGNPHIYPVNEQKYLDQDWVMLEIEDFMCRQNGSICGDDPMPRQREGADIKIIYPEQLCACGGEWEARFCPTCAGSKVQKFVCKQCGNAAP